MQPIKNADIYGLGSWYKIISNILVVIIKEHHTLPSEVIKWYKKKDRFAK